MIAGIIGTLIGGIFGFITRLTSPETSKDSKEAFKPFKIDKSTEPKESDQSVKRFND